MLYRKRLVNAADRKRVGIRLADVVSIDHRAVFGMRIKADAVIIQAIDRAHHVEADNVNIALAHVLPHAQAARQQIYRGSLPNIIDAARRGGKVHCRTAVEVGDRRIIAFERSAVNKVPVGDLGSVGFFVHPLRHVKVRAEGVSIAPNLRVLPHMNDGEFLLICKPYMAVGVCGGQCDLRGIAPRERTVVDNITAVINAVGNVCLAYGVERVIFQPRGAVDREIFGILYLFRKGGGLYLDAVLVDRFAVSVYKVVVDKYFAAAHGDLRLREFAGHLFVLVVSICQRSAFVCEQSLAGRGAVAIPDRDLIHERGIVALSDVADRPAYAAGGSVICRRALADVNIGIARIIDRPVGGDDGSLSRKAELNFIAHGVVYDRVFRRDRNAARDGGERRRQLFFNIVGVGYRKVVL